MANKWLARNCTQTHQAGCSARGAVCGQGAHSKFRSFLSLFWFLLSIWSFCMSSMPTRTRLTPGQPWTCKRVNQGYVDSLGPFWTPLLFTSQPRTGLPQPWPCAYRATGLSCLPAAKDYNYNCNSIDSATGLGHHPLLQINWAPSDSAAKLPVLMQPYPGRTSLLTKLEKMEGAQSSDIAESHCSWS